MTPVAADTGRRCRTCRHWLETRSDTRGECRAQPPQIAPRHQGFEHASVWPETRPDDWCGEHRAHGEGR